MNIFYQNKKYAAGYIVVFLLLLATVFSCEPEKTIFEGPHYVRFTRADTTVKESQTGPLRIAVHNAGPQLSTPITVTYTVGGNAREGIDYRFTGRKGTVVIPANQSFGYIGLELINNANNILESQDILFTIIDVEPASLRIGFGSGEIGKLMRFTIEDDCLLSGLYSAVLLNNAQSQTYRSIRISSTDCREYTLTNWNLGLFSLNALKPDFTFIDNGDNSITIPKQIESQLSAPRDTIDGNGFINPQDQSITFNLKLKVLGQNRQDSTIILNLKYTPQR
jgi:hypothetical protein